MPDNSTLVSLFTDASYNHNTQRGGWGAWARGSKGRVYNGGPFFHECSDPAEAELLAIAEGLKMCIRGGLIMYGYGILIQTDNMRVAHMMPIWSPARNTTATQSRRSKIPQPRNEYEREAMYYIHDIEKKYGLRIMGRWIKGHNHKKAQTKRSWINELVDKLAGKGRKLADKKYYNQNLIVDNLLYKPDRKDAAKTIRDDSDDDIQSTNQLVSTPRSTKEQQVDAAWEAKTGQDDIDQHAKAIDSRQSEPFQPDMLVVDFEKMTINGRTITGRIPHALEIQNPPTKSNSNSVKGSIRETITEYPKTGEWFQVDGELYKWVPYKLKAQTIYGDGKFQKAFTHEKNDYFKWKNGSPPPGRPYILSTTGRAGVIQPKPLEEIDYSQIELRVLAHMSDNEKEEYLKLHDQTHPDYVPWLETTGEE